MKENQLNKKIHAIANKMGLEFIEDNNLSIINSRMLNISKPERPEVKEFFQRQLENVAGIRKKWWGG